MKFPTWLNCLSRECVTLFWRACSDARSYGLSHTAALPALKDVTCALLREAKISYNMTPINIFVICILILKESPLTSCHGMWKYSEAVVFKLPYTLGSVKDKGSFRGPVRPMLLSLCGNIFQSWTQRRLSEDKSSLNLHSFPSLCLVCWNSWKVFLAGIGGRWSYQQLHNSLL